MAAHRFILEFPIIGEPEGLWPLAACAAYGVPQQPLAMARGPYPTDGMGYALPPSSIQNGCLSAFWQAASVQH
jgi:hypothetical protein